MIKSWVFCIFSIASAVGLFGASNEFSIVSWKFDMPSSLEDYNAIYENRAKTGLKEINMFSFLKKLFNIIRPYIVKKKEERLKWDYRFLQLAKHISEWSLDPSTKVGAVIIDQNKRIISLGYNGFPQGVEDRHDRLHNRDIKYKMVVHAERNAIIFAQRSLQNCILYTWPMMSCGPCAAMIIQAGIKRVVAPINDNPRWQDDFNLAKEMFYEAGVEVDLVDNLM
jgi:dCMP deaminase